MKVKYHHSEETKKKILESRKWYKHSEETKRKIRENHSHYWLGKHFPEETKRKLSEVRKNKKQSKETIEKRVSHFRGKKRIPFSKEWKQKMSLSKKGNNNPKWKGGVSSKNHIIRNGIEIRLWRESVFARDNWTCQKCKNKGIILRAHHIQNFSQYPELRFAIDNGITLCKKCHIEFHKKYWNKNNTKEQINEFIGIIK